MREAYRRRGWGFNNPQGIAQCEKEGFLTKLKVTGTCSWLRSSMMAHNVWPRWFLMQLHAIDMQDQQGEGCHMWGTLSVNKVSLLPAKPVTISI